MINFLKNQKDVGRALVYKVHINALVPLDSCCSLFTGELYNCMTVVNNMQCHNFPHCCVFLVHGQGTHEHTLIKDVENGVVFPVVFFSHQGCDINNCFWITHINEFVVLDKTACSLIKQYECTIPDYRLAIMFSYVVII